MEGYLFLEFCPYFLGNIPIFELLYFSEMGYYRLTEPSTVFFPEKAHHNQVQIGPKWSCYFRRREVI